MDHIYYVSAPAASGKTHAMCLKASEHVLKGENVLIVLPTLLLIDEIAIRVGALGLQARLQVLTSKTEIRVISSIIQALEDSSSRGRLLVITWTAFVSLPFFPNSREWAVFVDEIPQLFHGTDGCVPDTHQFLTDHIGLRPQGAEFGRVIVKSRYRLGKLASTRDTALLTHLAPTASKILSPNWLCYTRLSQFDKLLKGQSKTLNLYFTLRPRILHGFRRVTVLAANFERSLLYLAWRNEGINFFEDEDISARLRFTEHSNGYLVEIFYAIEGKWSKTARDRHDKKLLRKMVTASADLMDGNPFVWTANKDVCTDLFEGCAADRLPQIAHGLNAYADKNNVIYLAAMLPSADQFGFLAWRGISSNDVRTAVHGESVYQTALRCSIRDLQNRSIKKIVVPDRSSAEYLAALLPGSLVKKLDCGIDASTVGGGPGRQRVFEDGAARVRAHRAGRNAEADLLFALMTGRRNESAMHGMEIASSPLDDLPKTCNDKPLEKDAIRYVTPKYRGSIFVGMKATLPLFVVPEMTDDVFIAALKKVHRERRDQKEDNYLISPAVFDPSRSGATSRGLANVLSANGIWIDVDVGDLTHKDFASIFPHIRIVAFNSFSSTKAQPRYRIYIPTSRVLSSDEYASIVSQIVQVVRNVGFPLAKKDSMRDGMKVHGVDMSKRHAASLFYLPCQPKDPSGKIWKDYKGCLRKPLDVDDWFENAIPIVDARACYKESYWQHHTPLLGPPYIDNQRAARAIERWSSVGILPGMGDAELYRLGQELKRSRLPCYEAEKFLFEAARSANSPKDRIRQAEAIAKRYYRGWSDE